MIRKHVPISFEFFPPRSDAQKLALESTWQKLSRLNPNYLSVTFGAGGSTLDATLDTVSDLLEKSGVPVAPHISCMAQDRDMLCRLLQSYKESGVERLVVLRGDRRVIVGPGFDAETLSRVVTVLENPGDARDAASC